MDKKVVKLHDLEFIVKNIYVLKQKEISQKIGESSEEIKNIILSAFGLPTPCERHYRRSIHCPVCLANIEDWRGSAIKKIETMKKNNTDYVVVERMRNKKETIAEILHEYKDKVDTYFFNKAVELISSNNRSLYYAEVAFKYIIKFLFIRYVNQNIDNGKIFKDLPIKTLQFFFSVKFISHIEKSVLRGFNIPPYFSMDANMFFALRDTLPIFNYIEEEKAKKFLRVIYMYNKSVNLNAVSKKGIGAALCYLYSRKKSLNISLHKIALLFRMSRETIDDKVKLIEDLEEMNNWVFKTIPDIISDILSSKPKYTFIGAEPYRW